MIIPNKASEIFQLTLSHREYLKLYTMSNVMILWLMLFESQQLSSFSDIQSKIQRMLAYLIDLFI